MRQPSSKQRSARAGRMGDDVRSDVCIEITSGRESTDVTVESKVKSLYGPAIRATIERTLESFGAEGVAVHVIDAGALPYVISARAETALRKLGMAGRSLPDPAVAAPHSTPRDRLRRSRLYLPGNEPKFAINAGLHHPDGVILDLEDSVHPDEKLAARVLVRNALCCVDFLGAERMVRINQLPLGLEDLDEIVPRRPDVVLIPKVENASTVADVRRKIDSLRRANDIDAPIWLMPIVESALGVENAFEIASSDPTVAAITIGLEDYTADLGVRKTAQGGESLYARTRLVNAARAAGVQAIDSVFGDVGDLDGLRLWGQRSRALGFEGMGCVHPRQIRMVHDAFNPSASEIERAVDIVSAFEAATERGIGVVSVGTRMVDPPVVARAQRLVETARKMGLLPEPPAA